MAVDLLWRVEFGTTPTAKIHTILIPLILHLLCKLCKLILFILILLFIRITCIGEDKVLPHPKSLTAILGSLEVGGSSLELVKEFFPTDASCSPNCRELIIS
jgi:hypothetical protein